LGVLNQMGPALRRCAAIVLALIGTVPVDASETDQYYAWSRQPADSTRAINGKVALELELALKKVNGRESWKRRDCHSVIRHIMPQFSEFIYKNIGLWFSFQIQFPGNHAANPSLKIFFDVGQLQNEFAILTGRRNTDFNTSFLTCFNKSHC
jgi:hypothetical protein